MGNSPIQLVSVEENMLSRFKQWRNELRKYFREYRLLNDVNQREWFDKISHDRNQAVFGILSAEKTFSTNQHQLIGCCGLHYISWTNRTAEFGIYIGPEYRGNSFGKHALKKLIEYGFYELNLNRIWCEVYDNNHAIDLYKSLGFKVEGQMRQHYYSNGEYWDSRILGLLRDEWEY